MPDPGRQHRDDKDDRHEGSGGDLHLTDRRQAAVIMLLIGWTPLACRNQLTRIGWRRIVSPGGGSAARAAQSARALHCLQARGQGLPLVRLPMVTALST